MARGRPVKQGLDYFPFKVDLFSDEKISAISGEFGIKGEIILVKLLCAIYRDGYFIMWDEPVKMRLISTLPGISLELLERVVFRLVKWGFFEQDLFDSVKVLTSKGIQRRYFGIAKRRGSINENMPYRINVDNKSFIADNKSFIADNNSQRKDNSKELSSSFKDLDKKNNSNELQKKEDFLNDRERELEEREKQLEVREQAIREEEAKAKKRKKSLQPNIDFVDESFKEAFTLWLDYKRRIKDNYKTDMSIKFCYENLCKMSGNDPVFAMEIVKHSIANGYKGLFPPNQQKQSNGSNNNQLSAYEKKQQSVANIEASLFAELQQLNSDFIARQNGSADSVD